MIRSDAPLEAPQPLRDQARALLADRATTHERLLAEAAADAPSESLTAAACEVAAALRAGRKAIFFGNGGSAADALHLVAELVGRLRTERRPLAAIALASNPAVATALANDYGFVEAGFARELAGVGQPGDVGVALSTSGRSPNVLRALDVAREAGLRTVAFVGRDHLLDGKVDHVISVDATDVAVIQEIHIVLGHALCELVELEVGRRR
jgi:D-sedoheptulose 7-phosphate isomerase